MPSTQELRFAIISDTHLAPRGTEDGRWNNVTRKSVSVELLRALVDELVASEHSHALVLGDISETGELSDVESVLAALAAAGLTCWVVPGNHDVAIGPGVVSTAASTVEGIVSIEGVDVRPAEGVGLVGHGIRSDDGGDTCEAIRVPGRLPDVPLLLWASHHPLLSERPRLEAAGLRYSGDLTNRADVEALVRRHDGPVLALHGHLHTAVTTASAAVLQLGVPAVVEWPHAWTDAVIRVEGESVEVRTEMRPLPGSWSVMDVDTVLDPADQHWVFADGAWSVGSV